MRRIIAALLAFLSVSAVADVVHVYEKTLAGGIETQIADRTLDTGRSYLTEPASQKSGYIFTHWTISTQQAFSARVLGSPSTGSARSAAATHRGCGIPGSTRTFPEYRRMWP